VLDRAIERRVQPSSCLKRAIAGPKQNATERHGESALVTGQTGFILRLDGLCDGAIRIVSVEAELAAGVPHCHLSHGNR
jgi:hypothetical protein